MPVTVNACPLALSTAGYRALPPEITRLMSLALETPGLLSLAAGFTDNLTLPLDAVTRAANQLAADSASNPEHLQYGVNAGRPGLRSLVAHRLALLEPALDSDSLLPGIFITNGSQQALYLAMQVLCDPGDIVLVDRPSYFVYLEMLRGMGIQARSIPVDADGLIDPVALRQVLANIHHKGQRNRLKAVYFVSYFSNPTGRSLSAQEKETLAHLLHAEDCIVPVIEDAAYRELYFDAPHPAPTILADPAWADFPRLHLFTLTKPFATGLKVGGGVCTDPRWLAPMQHLKGHQDFGTANFTQAICEHALQSGEYDAHLQTLRASYAAKMHTLDRALEEAGLRSLGWSWQRPAGALYLWLTGPAHLDTGIDSDFCRAALDAGVLYVPGDLCFGDHPATNLVRLSYGVLSGPALIEAARRFVTAARRFA